MCVKFPLCPLELNDFSFFLGEGGCSLENVGQTHSYPELVRLTNA